MGKPGLSKLAFAVFAFCVVAAIASSAKTTLTNLVSFDGTDGSKPYYESLIQSTDGSFYGTTAYGGANGVGTVFKITPAGTLTTLHDFAGTDGGNPWTGLVQGSDGNFYGTTILGGASGWGTIFKITPKGSLTTLYSFKNSTDGGNPLGRLAQASNGIFYGTTSFGGGNPCSCGTVFKVTSAGTLTTLYTFVGGGTDGNYPEAGLVHASDGNFYGTTTAGGTSGIGTVFRITPAGTLTTLHNFDGTDGANPWAGLVQGSDGNFYGVTANSGGLGTVFKITPAGTLTTLHNFDGTDGANPWAALVQGTDGNFYGTTYYGGANGDGTVFKITPAGALTTLHDFDGADGGNSLGGLAQATDGTFYGTTTGGGGFLVGTIFSLSVGLGPFVETRPTFGKVGAKVIILGNNLTGTTSVTFNGTAASFNVLSSFEITTNVPTGATMGTVVVNTPKKVLQSNVVFRVTK